MKVLDTVVVITGACIIVYILSTCIREERVESRYRPFILYS